MKNRERLLNTAIYDLLCTIQKNADCCPIYAVTGRKGLCSRDNPADKWFFEAYNDYHVRRFTPPATYEAIGKHFNSNPYGLEKDTLEKHGEKLLDVKRDFESVKEFLREHYIEGIVFWFGGEPVCKIKRSDFGFEWGAKK